MQRMNAKRIMILICEFNVAITLTARKNIIKMRKFKKLIMFRVFSEKNKKNTEVERLLNQERRYNNDFSSRRIRNNNA